MAENNENAALISSALKRLQAAMEKSEKAALEQTKRLEKLNRCIKQMDQIEFKVQETKVKLDISALTRWQNDFERALPKVSSKMTFKIQAEKPALPTPKVQPVKPTLQILTPFIGDNGNGGYQSRLRYQSQLFGTGNGGGKISIDDASFKGSEISGYVKEIVSTVKDLIPEEANDAKTMASVVELGALVFEIGSEIVEKNKEKERIREQLKDNFANQAGNFAQLFISEGKMGVQVNDQNEYLRKNAGIEMVDFVENTSFSGLISIAREAAIILHQGLGIQGNDLIKMTALADVAGTHKGIGADQAAYIIADAVTNGSVESAMKISKLLSFSKPLEESLIRAAEKGGETWEYAIENAIRNADSISMEKEIQQRPSDTITSIENQIIKVQEKFAASEGTKRNLQRFNQIVQGENYEQYLKNKEGMTDQVLSSIEARLEHMDEPGAQEDLDYLIATLTGDTLFVAMRDMLRERDELYKAQGELARKDGVDPNNVEITGKYAVSENNPADYVMGQIIQDYSGLGIEDIIKGFLPAYQKGLEGNKLAEQAENADSMAKKIGVIEQIIIQEQAKLIANLGPSQTESDEKKINDMKKQIDFLHLAGKAQRELRDKSYKEAEKMPAYNMTAAGFADYIEEQLSTLKFDKNLGVTKEEYEKAQKVIDATENLAIVLRGQSTADKPITSDDLFSLLFKLNNNEPFPQAPPIVKPEDKNTSSAEIASGKTKPNENRAVAEGETVFKLLFDFGKVLAAVNGDFAKASSDFVKEIRNGITKITTATSAVDALVNWIATIRKTFSFSGINNENHDPKDPKNSKLPTKPAGGSTGHTVENALAQMPTLGEAVLISYSTQDAIFRNSDIQDIISKNIDLNIKIDGMETRQNAYAISDAGTGGTDPSMSKPETKVAKVAKKQKVRRSSNSSNVESEDSEWTSLMHELIQAQTVERVISYAPQFAITQTNNVKEEGLSYQEFIDKLTNDLYSQGETFVDNAQYGIKSGT